MESFVKSCPEKEVPKALLFHQIVIVPERGIKTDSQTKKHAINWGQLTERWSLLDAYVGVMSNKLINSAILLESWLTCSLLVCSKSSICQEKGLQALWAGGQYMLMRLKDSLTHWTWLAFPLISLILVHKLFVPLVLISKWISPHSLAFFLKQIMHSFVSTIHLSLSLSRQDSSYVKLPEP